jgi:hypothetical protein
MIFSGKKSRFFVQKIHSQLIGLFYPSLHERWQKAGQIIKGSKVEATE